MALLCCVSLQSFFVLWCHGPAGGAHVESRWSDCGKLQVFFSRKGPQQKLPDIAQRRISLRVAHPKHGGEVEYYVIILNLFSKLDDMVNDCLIVSLL